MPLISSIERPPVGSAKNSKVLPNQIDAGIDDSAIAVTARADLDESGHVLHVSVGPSYSGRRLTAGSAPGPKPPVTGPGRRVGDRLILRGENLPLPAEVIPASVVGAFWSMDVAGASSLARRRLGRPPARRAPRFRIAADSNGDSNGSSQRLPPATGDSA
jgi:hypothetical protein